MSFTAHQLKAAFSGKRVLITGNTGFKGSWLAMWLHCQGARVFGYSLSPTGTTSHFDTLKVDYETCIGDIRDEQKLKSFIERIRPDLVIHLAAQALVRESYVSPIETLSVNAVGTASVIYHSLHSGSVRAILNVTTDKCYRNHEWDWPYREVDELGGHDPYSMSKACAELVGDSMRSSFGTTGKLIASARAGNILGGGDWSTDRLVPDAIRATQARSPLTLRYPGATRPWQHVLDALKGYLMLSAQLMEGKSGFEGAWNFGPSDSSSRTVGEIVERVSQRLGLEVRVEVGEKPHEAGKLQLDTSKARARLQWTPSLDFDATLDWTLEWYESFLAGKSLTEAQIRRYEALLG